MASPNRFLAAVSLLIGLLAGFSSTLPASDLGPVFRSLGVVDGLPDSRVEAIVQDRYGYIWIGTQAGLVRHEGRKLNLLSHDASRPGALPGVNIMSLHAHSSGLVWAGIAGQGVVAIGPDLKTRVHLPPEAEGGPLPDQQVWSIAEDCEGGVWMAFMRGGLARFDPGDETLRFYRQNDEDGLAESGFQLQVHVDSRCRIWSIQSDQVSVLAALHEDQFEKVITRDLENGEPIFNAFFELSDGTLLVAQTSRLLEVGSDHSIRQLLELENTITDFAEQDDGWLLMSTYGGLFKWQRESNHKVWVGVVDGLRDGLPTNRLLGLMIDFEGGLWVPAMHHGVAYLPPGYEGFTRYQSLPGNDSGLQLKSVRAVTQQGSEPVLWLGDLDDGIQRLDLVSGEIEWFRDIFGEDQLSVSPEASFLVDVSDQLILGSSRNILAFDKLEHSERFLLSREQIDQGTFSFMWPDGQERLWVSTFDAGLIRVSLAGDEREHFHPAGEGYYHLPENEIGMLTRDGNGNWWLAGRRDIYQYQPRQGFEHQFHSQGGRIQALTWIDRELWLATDFSLEVWGLGEAGFERRRSWSLSDALPGGRILGLFGSDTQQVWLVLSNGLARVDQGTGRIRRFSRDDGLAVTEFLRNATVQLDDGRLAIGSARGLIIVDPERIQGSDAVPPVHITDLEAGGRNWLIDPGERETIALSHRDNSVALEFVALSYISPDQTRYRLRLDGWDDDWLELTGQNRQIYSNLAPGRYRFRVQAATPDGSWSESGDELAFRIQQPPWRSAWAIALYGLVLAGGAGAGWRSHRLTRQRRREIEEARQKRALAEEQRQVVERLNRSLQPDKLGQVIAEELCQVTGAERAWFHYRHEQLPDRPITVGPDADRLDRSEIKDHSNLADSANQQVVDFTVEDQIIARCLIESGNAGFQPDHGERLRLLQQTASQVLHNLLLIERVRALAERAEEASAAKSEFLATMSHEIRTPLHGVLGMLELLHETNATVEQQELLATLRQSGLQLQRIIDDVLDISRIEAGRLDLDNEPFELVSLLEQVVDLHGPNAARKSIDLRLRVASDLPLLARGDAGRIVQVLGNLLSNAVKFTDEGAIELVAECWQPGWLQLSVSDSGPGIGPEDRERLFQPFSQLDASITRSHSGSGLGLAICRRLVAAMKGELYLAERHQNGSTFVVRLPVLPQSISSSFPLTGLLDDVVVASALDASSFRILLRLARRWNFAVIDARRFPAQRCDALLVDHLGPVAKVESWLAMTRHLVRLDIPYRSPPASIRFNGTTHSLRWPLVESRLLGLLLDWRLQGSYAAGESGADQESGN